MGKAEDVLNSLGTVTAAGVLDGDQDNVLQSYEGAAAGGGAGGIPMVGAPPPSPRRGPQDYSRTPARQVQRRLSEVFFRYGPEKDPQFMVTVNKLFPVSRTGGSGYLDDFNHPITERDLKGLWGGGRYEIVIKGTHPKTGEPGHTKETIIVDIAGQPRDPDEEDRVPSRRRRRFSGDGAGYRPTFPQPPVTVQPDNSATTMAFQTLRDVLSSKASGKDEMIDQLRALVDNPQRHGLDPSTVQSLIDSHEAQKAAVQARYESMLTEERERASRDIERSTSRLERQLEDERAARTRSEEDWRRREEQLRERLEREVKDLRQSLEDERRDNQRQIDRMEENHRDTLKRMTDDHKSETTRLMASQAEELKRVRHDLETRTQAAEKAKEDAIRLLERSKENELNIERERSKMLVDQVSENARTQMESVTRQAETNTTHMRQLSEVNQKVQETTAESLRRQLEFEAEQEREEKRRAQRELERLRGQLNEKEDLPTQVGKLRDLAELFGGSLGGSDENAIVPAGEDSDSSLLGRVERLMNTRFGQRAGEVAGAVLGGLMQPKGPQGAVQPPQIQGPPPQPVAPTPRAPQTVAAPQGVMAPPTYAQPQTGPVPTRAEIEAQIEQVLGGQSPMPQQSPQSQQPQQSQGSVHPAMMTGPPPAPDPALVDTAMNQITSWVQTVEAHIENDAPVEPIVNEMAQALPPEAMMGFLNGDIEVIVGEIAGNIKNRGIITSEKGISYLKRVQAILRQSVGPQPE